MFQLIVREYERIRVVATRVGDQRVLTPAEVDALLAVCERYEIAPMSAGYRCVKFAQHCGVIQAGGVSVEILPKIAEDDNFDRGLLLRILAVAGDFPIQRLDEHQVLLQSHSLLRALIRWFCRELYAQCHVGLLREYVTQSDDLPVIRGRWRADLDVHRFPGRKDRLCCEFDELTPDNRYNRALKSALRRARGLALGAEALMRDIDLLLGWFVDVADVSVSADEVRRFPANRLVARYKGALQMAEWFLADRSPDLSTGRAGGFGLLFDMNALFQTFVAKLLRRVLPDDLRLREEAPRYFLTMGPDGNRKFQMKPDLCVLRGDAVIAIIDAKWKRLRPDATDGKWDVQQADVYQLQAYSTAYVCPRVALWYPGHRELNDITPRPEFSFLVKGETRAGSSLGVDWIHLDGADNPAGWLKGVTSRTASALARLGIADVRAEPAFVSRLSEALAGGLAIR